MQSSRLKACSSENRYQEAGAWSGPSLTMFSHLYTAPAAGVLLTCPWFGFLIVWYQVVLLCWAMFLRVMWLIFVDYCVLHRISFHAWVQHSLSNLLSRRFVPVRNTRCVVLFHKFAFILYGKKILRRLLKRLPRQLLPCGIRLMAMYLLVSELALQSHELIVVSFPRLSHFLTLNFIPSSLLFYSSPC